MSHYNCTSKLHRGEQTKQNPLQRQSVLPLTVIPIFTAILDCRGPIRPNFSLLLTTLLARQLAGGRTSLLLCKCFPWKFLECNSFSGLEECGYQLIPSGSGAKAGSDSPEAQSGHQAEAALWQAEGVIYYDTPQSVRSCLLPFSWAALQKAAAAPWQLPMVKPAFLSPTQLLAGSLSQVFWEEQMPWVR